MCGPCPLGLRDAVCPGGCRDAGGGLSVSPGPTHKPETEDREAAGQGGPGPASPRGSKSSVQFLGPAPQRPRPEVQVPGFRGPRLPSQGPAQSPQKLSLNPLPQPSPRWNRSRGTQKPGGRRGLDEDPPWSGESVSGVPTCTEGSFLPFSKFGIVAL